MLLSIAFTCLAAIAADRQGQPALDELLTKLCPARDSYRLNADETAIVGELLEHYRRFEWSPERARREGTFAPASLARHAVPSLRSPQVLLLDTIRYEPAFDAAVAVELQRHAVPVHIADELRSAFRTQNTAPVVLSPPDMGKVLRLRCKDVFAMAYGGSQPSGDHANVSKATSISRPVFDRQRTTALVLSINDLGYLLEGKTDDVELTLLQATEPGKWQIAWHAVIGESLRHGDVATATVTAEDYAVFDAVLARLAEGMFRNSGCVAVVNQTEPLPAGPWRMVAPQAIVAPSESAAGDLARRGASSLYLGAYSPKRTAKLVQREVFETLSREDRGGCGAAIRFSLPGYGSTNRAILTYSVQAAGPEGVEVGEGWALLTRTKEGWRVDRDAYERSFLMPR